MHETIIYSKDHYNNQVKRCRNIKEHRYYIYLNRLESKILRWGIYLNRYYVYAKVTIHIGARLQHYVMVDN